MGGAYTQVHTLEQRPMCDIGYKDICWTCVEKCADVYVYAEHKVLAPYQSHVQGEEDDSYCSHIITDLPRKGKKKSWYTMHEE